MAIDFVTVAVRNKKDGIEIYPKFILNDSSDLMIRGGDFYAIWVEERGQWSTSEQDAIKIIDDLLDQRAKEEREKTNVPIRVLHMWDSETGMIDAWHKYCQKQRRDSYHMLDETLVFSNSEARKEDYSSKRLPYPLEAGDISAYDELMKVIYTPEERHKIEWAIGAIVSGDSKKIQKFMVLYGAAGTGKSTVLNIIQQLFDGYYSVFDAKALGSSNNAFALESFKTNPLVAIQHDGDLSKIEDNTRLNSLVSHEKMTVNEKFKAQYANDFKCFLFMGTNKPVKITDAKSGLIRRLIDVSPSGEKVDFRKYKSLTKQITFELGAIAKYCLDVYLEDPGYYDDYIPLNMLGASNDFYNFVMDSYFVFKDKDGISLKAAWEMYKNYCDDARVTFSYPQRIFKEELKNYFRNFDERFTTEDETRVRNYYSGFRTDKFENTRKEVKPKETSLKLTCTKSKFDDIFKGCFAQYANDAETPSKKWADVTTKLEDIDTTKLHYVKVPNNLIVIDFDIKDENGEKCYERNVEEACKWPPTYAELSKSGAGVHLHYFYDGDVGRLCNVYDKDIEIKVFTGNSSLRRKVSKCNSLPIATINSGLPLKGEKKVLNADSIKSEKGLRDMIKRNLKKEFHGATKPSVDFIYTILEDAYKNGLKYDVSDMYNQIFAFAAGSSHQADYCIKLVSKMKFKSENPSESTDILDANIVFYDVEVFSNLFLVNWKFRGPEHSVVRMINPTPEEIEGLLRFKLVGFNNRRYDNHMLYARLMGYSNEQLFELSQKIVNGEPNCFFGEAFNLSYTDIYDFSSKKQSLKKFEIELGIHHQELGLPWDQPVPEDMWNKVAEYCDNDVIATEAVFEARHADFVARQILADVAGMSVNDTTNSLTTRIIFGTNKKPQSAFNYRDMGNTDQPLYTWTMTGDTVLYDGIGDEYTLFDGQCRPIFPGYKFDAGKSTYRGEEVGEGGYVYAEPGMYGNVALLDVASMHPSSVVAENLFGDQYTAKFKEILDARIEIKHANFDKAGKMLGGKLAKYLRDKDSASDLAKALKIAINSVYGLTSATFDNPFRDRRNVDNIVAKRGALFMINLKHEVQRRGFTVAHIKTDSIKIPDATPEIIQFVMDYGHMYGYNFEHEDTYERMCLVNDAVYIAKDKNGEWTATGAQFQVPYVFKTLFSKEPIEFRDVCETKSVSSSLYLDMNEMLSPDDHNYVFIGKVGQFCPILPGRGGGILYREKDGKYYAATGTKGYRWLESEMVSQLGMDGDIDISYYDTLVNDAIQTMSRYGDVEKFISDDPYYSFEEFDDSFNKR